MWWILIFVLFFAIGFLFELRVFGDIVSSIMTGFGALILGGMIWFMISILVLSSYSIGTEKSVDNIKIEDNVRVVKVIDGSDTLDGIKNGDKIYVIDETNYGSKYKIKHITYKTSGIWFPITDTVVEVTIPPK